MTASSEKYILQVFLARVMCDLAGFHSRDWEVHEEQVFTQAVPLS